MPQRGDDGNVFRQGLVGIGWVALVAVLITLIAGLLAVVISLGY